MKDEIYNEFIKAKNKRDLNKMRELYEQNKNDLSIKLEYGKLLARNKYYNEALAILGSLINTGKKTQALMALGKLEMRFRNYDSAREYFKSILEIREDTYAMSELGRLELKLGLEINTTKLSIGVFLQP